jgi:glucose/arabinose dehydrogenase
MPRSLARTVAVTAALFVGTANLTATPAAAASDVTLTPVLDGYTRPVLVTHAGEGRTIFIVEQTGRIKRATFENGGWQKLGTFLDLSDKVVDPRTEGNSERGLLGLAFDPDYESNGRFYVHYTRRGPPRARGDIVIAEFRRQTEGTADPGSRRVLMRVEHPVSNHNGGNLVFGPDGLLYIGLGDGGGSGDPFRNGLDRRSRLGKILRIDPRAGAGRPFRVPASNPFVGRRGLDEIWAFGLRNPWRSSFDRLTGDLWIGDVGQSRREEVDLAVANDAGRNAGRGKNFGWSRCEGTLEFRPDPNRACRVGKRPLHDYGHGSGRCSVTGGYVHRGPSAADWHGLYVAGDFCGRLFVLNRRGSVRRSTDTGRSLSSFGEDAAGRIFATDLGGEVLEVGFVGERP